MIFRITFDCFWLSKMNSILRRVKIHVEYPIFLCMMYLFSLWSQNLLLSFQKFQAWFLQLNFQNQSCQNLYQSHLGVAFFSLFSILRKNLKNFVFIVTNLVTNAWGARKRCALAPHAKVRHGAGIPAKLSKFHRSKIDYRFLDKFPYNLSNCHVYILFETFGIAKNVFGPFLGQRMPQGYKSCDAPGVKINLNRGL